MQLESTMPSLLDIEPLALSEVLDQNESESSEDDYGSEAWELSEDDYTPKPAVTQDPPYNQNAYEPELDKSSVSSSVLLSYLELLNNDQNFKPQQPPIIFQRTMKQEYDDAGYQASSEEDEDTDSESKPSKRLKRA